MVFLLSISASADEGSTSGMAVVITAGLHPCCCARVGFPEARILLRSRLYILVDPFGVMPVNLIYVHPQRQPLSPALSPGANNGHVALCSLKDGNHQVHIVLGSLSVEVVPNLKDRAFHLFSDFRHISMDDVFFHLRNCLIRQRPSWLR